VASRNEPSCGSSRGPAMQSMGVDVVRPTFGAPIMGDILGYLERAQLYMIWEAVFLALVFGCLLLNS
jgi:hypothetical protein